MRLRKLAAAALAAALPFLSSASAQERRGGPPGTFDFYVLALSWSPGFCALEGDRKNRSQCQAGSGTGFTVHGLWPQFEQGWPVACEPAASTPSRIALEQARGVFPEEGLARHQWRRHGTCSGLSPTDYFRAARQARDRVVIPEAFREPKQAQRWTPLDLERGFAAANPGLRPDMMSVVCRRGVLQEVRICLEKDLRNFRACPQVDRSGCRFGELDVNSVR